jgi:hypothetical protein
MPSVKPRLALTLPEHRYELLRRLAALQGVSMASVVTELLEECYPVLERVAVALEAAKSASESVKSGLRDSCDKAIEELEPYRDQFMDQFDLFMDGITSQARTATEIATPPQGGGASAGDGRAGGVVNPRVVTRGSGTSTPLPLNQVKKARKPSATRVSK